MGDENSPGHWVMKTLCGALWVMKALSGAIPHRATSTQNSRMNVATRRTLPSRFRVETFCSLKMPSRGSTLYAHCLKEVQQPLILKQVCTFLKSLGYTLTPPNSMSERVGTTKKNDSSGYTHVPMCPRDRAKMNTKLLAIYTAS